MNVSDCNVSPPSVQAASAGRFAFSRADAVHALWGSKGRQSMAQQGHFTMTEDTSDACERQCVVLRSSVVCALLARVP